MANNLNAADTQPTRGARRQPGPFRWLPLFIALLAATLHVLIMIALSLTDWEDGIVFYPLVHALNFTSHYQLCSFHLLTISLGMLWYALDNLLKLMATTVFVALYLLCWTAALLLARPDFEGIALVPVEKVHHNSHSYRLIIRTENADGVLFSNFDNTLIVYRCDRFGLLCNGIYSINKYPDGIELDGTNNPAVTASQTGDLRLALDDVGRLSIHYYDEVLFVTGPDD